MKRLLLASAILISVSTCSFAQTDKGWRSVGGTGTLALDFKNNSYTFGLTPELYWFVGNNFALGTDFGVGFYSTKMSDSSSVSGMSAYVTPGVRYFFGTTDHKWRPYVFGNGGFEYSAGHVKAGNSTTNSTSSGFRGYAGAGLDWFFNQHAAFDIRLHVIDYTQKSAAFNPTFSIGLQAFFDHE